MTEKTASAGQVLPTGSECIAKWAPEATDGARFEVLPWGSRSTIKRRVPSERRIPQPSTDHMIQRRDKDPPMALLGLHREPLSKNVQNQDAARSLVLVQTLVVNPHCYAKISRHERFAIPNSLGPRPQHCVFSVPP